MECRSEEEEEEEKKVAAIYMYVCRLDRWWRWRKDGSDRNGLI